MAIDIYKTKVMLAAIKQMTPATTFLRDRYFPASTGDMFPTDEVLVEYMDSTGQKLAPVVLPRKGSVNVERNGYTTSRMTPPLIAPSRPLTIDELNKKGFGENLFSDRTPAQRQAEILVQDLADFDQMISAREEFMASECMFKNGYVMKQYGDKYGDTTEYKEYELKFYSEGTNPAAYTPGNKWGTAGSDIMADLHQMILMLTRKGNAASEVLLGSDAAETLMKDETIKKMMDLLRYNVGEIAPVSLPQGAARLGRLNIMGRNIDLLTYDGTYTDDDGSLKSFVPAKEICVTAPAAGRLLRGAVTQVEQSDGEYHTYMGARIPRYWAEKDGRSLTVSSRPILAPKTKNPFISAKVID